MKRLLILCSLFAFPLLRGASALAQDSSPLPSIPKGRRSRTTSPGHGQQHSNAHQLDGSAR
jgi:hypothetical protein